MSVKGIILDRNNKMIRQEGKIYCQVEFGNGDIQNQFVEEEFLLLNSEAVAGGSGDMQNQFVEEELLQSSSKAVAGGSGDIQDQFVEEEFLQFSSEAVAGGSDTEFQWTSAMIKLLIQTYKTVKEDGGQRIKLQKHLWQKIAAKISEKGYTVSGPQCDNKWKGLMKMYKKYKDRENTTGEAGGEVWDYYDAMDDILFKKPYITPVALSSNLKGYRLEIAKQVNKKRNLECSDENVPNNLQLSKDPLEDGEPSNKKTNKNGKKALDTSRNSLLNRLCLSIDEKYETQQALQERFVSTFEKYLEFVKLNFQNKPT